MWGEEHSSPRKQQMESPEARNYLAYLRQSEETSVAGVERMKAGVAEDTARGN